MIHVELFIRYPTIVVSLPESFPILPLQIRTYLVDTYVRTYIVRANWLDLDVLPSFLPPKDTGGGIVAILRSYSEFWSDDDNEDEVGSKWNLLSKFVPLSQSIKVKKMARIKST